MRWKGRTTGLPDTNPCSLPNATMLPEKVIAPMSTDAAIDTSVRTSSPPTIVISAAATSAEAPPPKPLNAATS